MKKSTSTFWKLRIRTLAENNPEKSAAHIERALKREQHERKRAIGPPGYKTVQRLVADARDTESTERDKYGPFSWPVSMDLKLVPWEAAEDCFDLLRRLTPDLREHIPAALMERLWRVKQAAPEMPVLDRLRLAIRLSIFERLEIAEGIQWCQFILIEELWKPKRPIKEGRRQLELIEQAVAHRKDISIPDEFIRALAEAEVDQPEPLLWTLPTRLHILSQALGFHQIELSLWGPELAAQEEDIGVMKKEIKAIKEETESMKSRLSEKLRSAPAPTGGGLLDPATGETPGDSNETES